MKRTAFTLIEILIVVILLGILAAIVIPQFSETTEEAETSTCKANMQALGNQVQLYKFKSGGTIPSAANLVTEGYLPQEPTCPIDGASYVIDGTTGAVTCPNDTDAAGTHDVND